ncbi:acyl-CoA N-acyltransferase [Collybia nuda]|uniref:Acyl-CoA N-acyltransferase n=1 Tax=Collybia nuda TaxID=64659 RepID=A0A9P5Y770_9AGAR|nr:acyl-CoA N-acyltransferase [Collybia nuda]
MSLPSKNGVRIRKFRASDLNGVRELFMLGMARGPGSPRRVALKESLLDWASCLAYLLVFSSVVLAAQYPQWRTIGYSLLIGATTLFFTYRWMISESFIAYCNNSLKTDLADIANFYHMKPMDSDDKEELSPVGPSGFWVVEREYTDGRESEIVGCVGLDCHLKDGNLRAELRRMVVSPHHRRLGIAALLIQQLVAHARQHRMTAVYLGTTQYQHAAIRMYQKFGWVESRRDFYREGTIKVTLLEYRLDL